MEWLKAIPSLIAAAAAVAAAVAAWLGALSAKQAAAAAKSTAAAAERAEEARWVEDMASLVRISHMIELSDLVARLPAHLEARKDDLVADAVVKAGKVPKMLGDQGFERRFPDALAKLRAIRQKGTGQQ